MRNPFTKSNGIDHSSAPLMAALVLVALVPVVGVLGFMSVAMRNERLAVQERLTAVYANHLASLQPRVTAWAKERQAQLSARAENQLPAEVFASVVRNGLADGVVVYDAAGKVLYPSSPISAEPVATENTELANALLVQAAELVQAGQKEPALAKLAELTDDPKFRHVTGAQGVLLVPDAQLLMLKTEMSWSRGALAAVSEQNAARASRPQQTLADLVTRLNDYSSADLPANQRRFLMTEVTQILNADQWSGGVPAAEPQTNATGASRLQLFPTLAGENLAAEYLEHDSPPPTDTAGDPKTAAAVGRGVPAEPFRQAQAPQPVEGPRLTEDGSPYGRTREQSHGVRIASMLQPTPLAKVWRLPSADGTVIALFREERLRSELAKQLDPLALPDVRVSLLAPGESPAATMKMPVAPLDAGEFFPGWRLALRFRDGDPLAEASARQTRFYLWLGVGVVAIIAALALMVARYVAAQMRLARMKDELVSTVSHELKTPLASMRVLLDTMSAGRYRDEAQMHRYMHLATKENLRLSHLIDNFLVFSRLERGQQQFVFTELSPRELVQTAVGALGEKLRAPHCHLTTQLAPDLPAIRGDADALSTVLINLLDNACKYSNGEKYIEMNVGAEGEHVAFAVTDNGIGIAPDEQRRIFDRFYQVDQSLTRPKGGCGLGLSIVQSIVRAHGGVVEVSSVPGQGSTFRVKIPVMSRQSECATASAYQSKPINHGLRG